MNFFDRLYLSVFNQVKKYKPKLAARWARFYVSVFQIAMCLFFGIFFMKFSKQMKLNILDDTSLWIVSLGIIVFIFFKNLPLILTLKNGIMNPFFLRKK